MNCSDQLNIRNYIQYFEGNAHEFCRSVVGYHFYDKVLAILNMVNK